MFQKPETAPSESVELRPGLSSWNIRLRTLWPIEKRDKHKPLQSTLPKHVLEKYESGRLFAEARSESC
jgi:hypothetical protein